MTDGETRFLDLTKIRLTASTLLRSSTVLRQSLSTLDKVRLLRNVEYHRLGLRRSFDNSKFFRVKESCIKDQ
jgi:hypothetical protein